MLALPLSDAAPRYPSQLCALTAKVAQQRTEVPEAVRTHFATQHDAHYAQIADAAERARAAERAPLPPPPPPDAAAAERLRALAARDSALARELREVSSDVHALAAAQSTLLSELDGVIALESRPCVTQQTIGGVKALAHTYARRERARRWRGAARDWPSTWWLLTCAACVCLLPPPLSSPPVARAQRAECAGARARRDAAAAFHLGLSATAPERHARARTCDGPRPCVMAAPSAT